MDTPPLSLREINDFERKQFIAALSSLFEGPPHIIEQVWQRRPFESRDQLYQELCTILFRSSEEQQIALLRAHPDLVGRAALAGTLSPSSTGEQAAAGLDRLSPSEIATFNELNRAYQTRFGFPFVICARANKKESILNGFATRLQHTREQEIEIALGEVAQICRFRLQDLVQP